MGKRSAPIMIEPETGAQMPLHCATQPIERGASFHNTRGRMRLRPSDPAAPRIKAAAVRERLEVLTLPWRERR
jgi:hypothetical protein